MAALSPTSRPSPSFGALLVVDDDPEIRDSLADLMADAGYEVRTAANGQEALNVLAGRGRPCLVLLDLMMPVMDGRTFLTRVRQDAALADLPVVIVSASNFNLESLPRADGYLKKPFDVDQLLEIVRRYCGP